MPALGLPTAEQEITADASGYLKAIDEIMARNDEWLAGTRKIRDDLGDLSRSLDDFERNLPDFKINMMVDDHFNDAVGGIRDNIMKMAGDALKANADMEAAWKGHGQAVDEITVRYENARASISQMASDALDQNQNLADSFDNLHAKVVRLTDAHLELNRVVGVGGGGGGGGTGGGGRSGDGGGGALVPIGRGGGGGGDAGWTWTATVVPAMHDFQRALTAGASYVRAYGPGVGGSTGPTIWPAAQYSPFGPNQDGPGGAGLWPAFAATGGAAHGGGSGGGVGAFLGAAAGGMGNWGRGAGAALSGMTDGGGGSTAFETSQVVTGFIRRWYPAAHWAMMLTNEMLATVGPAVAAAGMGALVGMQSVEQVAPRVGAIFNAAESIGSTMGQTTGQFWGLKTGILQNAQDLATGSAVELLGAGVNIMKAGAGGPFVQLGSNTVSMVDRFAATLTQDFQKGGLGKQLGNLVGGGTGYLQQFGDVLANVGRTFLNVAPNLPGVGGDLLSTLQGGTKALSSVTGWLGPALGPILGFEAAARWGPALVGMGSRTLGRAGMIPGLGALGTAPRAATAAEAAAGIGGAAAEGDIIAGTGVAGLLGGLTAPEIGVLGGTAFMLGKGLTYQTPGQQYAGGLVSQVNQAGIAQSIPMAIAAMQKLSGTKGPDYPTSGLGGAFYQDLNNIFTTGRGLAKGHPGALVTGVEAGVKGFWDEMFGGKALPSNLQAANAAINQLSQGMVNAFGAGQQISDQWKKVSGTTIGMGKAFDIATMAQLQLGSSFEKNGKLTGQAKTMIANLYAGYAPMNMNSGMMGAAVGAQTAMSGLQHTQVGAVNAAYDQLMQVVTGGGAGSASIFGLLGGTPTTHRVGGLSFAAPPAIKAMASALTSFTSASGAGAWNTFANPQTGMMSALQGQLDWLRNAQVMGALGPGDTTGMAGFLISQFLPVARKSPGALSALSMAAQQFGGPSFMPGTSAGGMFKGLSGWAQQFGTGSGGYNKMMNLAMQHLGNIPLDAQQFVQQIGSNVGGLPAGVQAYGANLQTAFMNSMGGPGGGFNLQALERYGKYMAGIGIPKTGAIDMAKYAAQIAGAGPHTQALVASQLGNLYAKLKIQVDTSAAKAAIANLTHVSNQPKVTVKAEVAAAVAAINAIKGKDIPITVKEQGAAAVEAAINAIHGKNVTVTITTINRMITQAVGAGIIGHPGGVLAATFAGGPAGMRITGHAAGGLVGGTGSGDHVPALLEPGEAIVPRFLVPLVAPILKSHHVPGFQSGGIAGAGSTPWLPYWEYEAKKRGWVPPTIHSGTGGGASTVDGTAKQFAFTLTGKIAEEVKNAAGAKKIADALITKIGQEVTLAKNVSSAAMQGQGFGNSGIFGNMDVTPGTGNGTVMEQMQSYLSSVQSFTKDLGTLRKEHLNKNIISQLVGAGPVQGDALAQSILNDYGGVKGINQVWGQLGHATKGLGAQAAMAQYGGMLAPNLKSGSFSSNNVTININAGNASGGLGLTATQIKSIVEQVQAALLKQAKRNRQTGVALRNKKA